MCWHSEYEQKFGDSHSFYAIIPRVQTLAAMFYLHFNPFSFIRGLSCPRSVETSLTQNYLKLTILGFSYNLLPVSCGDIGFFKKHRSSFGLEIRPQNAFTAFRALLPSENYSAEWSGRVWLWQLPADRNSRLAHFLKIWSALKNHYFQQRAVTPDWMGTGAALPSENISGRFFHGLRNPLRI